MTKKRILTYILAVVFALCSMGFLWNFVYTDASTVYTVKIDGNLLSATKNATALSDTRQGLKITSTVSGANAEGAKFSFDGVQTGDFELDFRVTSSKTYETADTANPAYTHTSKGNQDGGVFSFSDNYNPYNDVQEVTFTFTSNTNNEKWFKVHVRGCAIDSAGAGTAYMTSAWVEVNGDLSYVYREGFYNSPYGTVKGYALNNSGVYVDDSGATTNDWLFANLWGTSFSNYRCSDASTAGALPVSNLLRFDVETMCVYANKPTSSSHASYFASETTSDYLLRNVETNAGYTNSDPIRGVSSISKSDFQNGYTVSVEFLDMTDNATVGDASACANACWSSGRYKAISTGAYDRYANMTIYSVNGTSLTGDNVKVRDANVPDTLYKRDVSSYLSFNSSDVAVTEQSTNTLDVRKGLTVKSVASGTQAEGKGFAFADTMVGDFSLDFRVTSAKTFVSGDAVNPAFTHTLNNNVVSNRQVFSDNYNPYNDLQWIAFTFKSISNPDAWFIVNIKGSALDGNYGDGTAYMTSAWVEVNGDKSFLYNTDPTPKEYKGYGLQNGVYIDKSGTQTADYKFTNIWGTSFSNYKCFNATTTGATPLSNLIRFDVETMSVYVNKPTQDSQQSYFATASTADNLVRNVATNEGYTCEDPIRGVASLNPSDFVSGYTVSATFVDVTDNATKGFTTEQANSYFSSPSRYKGLDSAYDRYASITIYSINGQNMSYAIPEDKMMADLSVPSVGIPVSFALLNKEIDLTPNYYDPTSGNQGCVLGKVFYSIDGGNTYTEIPENDGFKFTATSYENVKIKYSEFKDSLGFVAPDTIFTLKILDDIKPNLVLKNGLEMITVFDWSNGGSARPQAISVSDVEIADKQNFKTYALEIVEVKDPTGLVFQTEVLNYQKFGDYTITYKATDNFGNEATLTRIIRVGDYSAPVINVSDLTVELGARVSLKVDVADYSSYTLTVIVKFDDKIVYNGDGKVDFIPEEAGTYTVKYTARDSGGLEDVKTVNLTVTDPNAVVESGDNGNTLSLIGYIAGGVGVLGFGLFITLWFIRRKKV